MPVLKPKKPLVVHLGNWGDKARRNGVPTYAEKTQKYARRFPNVQFIGIDKTKPRMRPRLKNWKQVRASFVDGLKRLRDNSVSVISAELSVGVDASLENAREVIKVSFKKLKPGGKLMILVRENTEPFWIVNAAFHRSGFEKQKIEKKKLHGPLNRTHWTKLYPEDVFIQFIARK